MGTPGPDDDIAERLRGHVGVDIDGSIWTDCGQDIDDLMGDAIIEIDLLRAMIRRFAADRFALLELQDDEPLPDGQVALIMDGSLTLSSEEAAAVRRALGGGDDE